MEQSQTRLMGVLAAALATVTAALWWWETPETDADPNATVPIWSIAAEDLVRIEVVRTGGRLVLESTDSGWVVTEPERFDADPGQVRTLATALASIESGIPIHAADPSEFGLGDPPTATVTVTPRGGVPQTLTFGAEAPVGWSTYARTAGGEVVAVPGKPLSDLTAGIEQFRDRRVLTFGVDSVRAVTLTSSEGTLTVRGDERGEQAAGAPPLDWWLEGFTRADPDRVDDLVSGLLLLRFDEILSHAPPLAEPTASVIVKTTERTWTVRVGPSDGGLSPVEVEGGSVGLVLTDALRILGMGPTDLGDSRAFPYDPDSTDRIEILSGEKHWLTVRNGPAWEVDGVESIGAAEVALAVDHALVAYTREPVPPADRVALSVIVGQGPWRRQVDLGPKVGDLAVARDVAGGTPYRVPEEDLTAIRRILGP